ncbi:MAG: penicillin-binding protein 2 [Caldilineaceae bacterium]|nr:penicillin-binding protein 2 [Caldilineaceae bacterium]HRJ41753.1 penicillin-binding protein 2 [Caldilineaceae bacterium]
MFTHERGEHTATLATAMVRLGLVVIFLVFVGRLYFLQIMQGATYQTQADNNRFRFIEVPPPRGVIYDRNGEILARNRPSFMISIVPAELPDDQIDTDVDEERLAIERLLQVLRADTDTEIALNLAEVMFLRLGRADFAKVVTDAGIDLTYRLVTLQFIEKDGESERLVETPTVIPDLSQVLPLEGLVALVYRAVQLGTQGSSFEAIPLLELVKRDSAFDVAEETYQLQGVRVQQVPVREYVYKDLVSHTLGFMGPIPALAADSYVAEGYRDPNEQVGLNGLEYTYQDELRGVPGQKYIEVDILGREMRTVGQVVDPVPGLNLRLSLDMRLQEMMYNSLAATAERVKSPNAVAIAMNPKTGAILGMVSLPSFDNNIFSEGIGPEYKALEQDERRPLLNYAIHGLYPPGSTFKLVSSTAALAEGVVDPTTLIADNGPIFLRNRFFPNDLTQAQKFVSWNHKLGIYHGNISIVQALALSNDIYFYWIGGGFPNALEGLGNERLAKWMGLFGYGDRTGIDLPGEVTSILPDDQWKRITWAESWTTGDSYNMSIGQGYVLGTPLQVLVSTAAVANGGYIMKPQLVQEMIDAEGGLQWEFTPQVVRELPISKSLLRYVQQGMWAAVNEPYGTAPNSRVPGVAVAGKTGTAEFCQWDPEIEDCAFRDKDDNLPFHAWYVAYAPFENPEIAVVVFVYNGGEGSSIAAPVAQQILDYYFNGPPPAEEELQTATSE